MFVVVEKLVIVVSVRFTGTSVPPELTVWADMIP